MNDEHKVGSSGISFVVYLTTKKLLIIIFSLQLALIGLVGLDNLGLGIPILRQVVGFIYLAFIPGFLILKLLRINSESATKVLLYSIGLSLSFLMFTGALMSFFYPFIGIEKPISEITLIFTLSIIVISLCIILFFRNKSSIISCINLNNILSPYTLLFILFPVLSILGVYLLNYDNSNLLLLVLFLLLAMIPLFVAFDKLPHKNLVFAIWAIALSLVLYNSLFGTYMRPTDNIYTFHLSKLVIENGIWNPSGPSGLNALLGDVILLPEFSLICKINLVWLYKAVVPLLSTLIPVGLYEVFTGRTNYKIAFLSSFFFISTITYFTGCSVIMKMTSAGLFLMLLILLMTDEEIDLTKKKIFAVIFAFSLVVSHYGTAYIFMFSLIIALVLFFFFKNYRKSKVSAFTTFNFTALFIALCISWYLYTGGGSIFESIVGIGTRVINNIRTELLFPEAYGTERLLHHFPMYLEILKGFYIVSGIFIFAGLLSTYYTQIRNKSMDEYAALSLGFFLFLIQPYLIGGIFAGRMWYISSFLLAPFVIVGFLTISKLVGKFLNFEHETGKRTMAIIGAFLCMFLLFNTSFPAEVIWKHNRGASVYISKPRILKEGSIEEKEYFYRVYLSKSDMESAKWLNKEMKENSKIFAGSNSEAPLRVNGLTPYGNKIGSSNVFRLTNKTQVNNDSYIYLSEFNNATGKIKSSPHGMGTFISHFDVKEISKEIHTSNKIYANGRSQVYQH